MFWWGPPITSIIFVPSHNEPLNGITSNVKKTRKKFFFNQKKPTKIAKIILKLSKIIEKYREFKIFRWILDWNDFFITCETVVKSETGSRLQCHTQNLKVHHLFKPGCFHEIWWFSLKFATEITCGARALFLAHFAAPAELWWRSWARNKRDKITPFRAKLRCEYGNTVSLIPYVYHVIRKWCKIIDQNCLNIPLWVHYQ